jgi:PAS domain S-box-containing protein
VSERARILVVDDEMGPRESLRMILKPHYEVATAENATAALDAVRAFRPDLIFTDIKMPEMDGIELLRRVKSIDASIEVVMITAYASLDTVKHALTHGAFEYLVKPFSRQELEETARRALARRHAELGTRSQLASLVENMRSLSAQTRQREMEAARRQQAEQSLRITQLSVLREVSRGILGQLDLPELLASMIAQLREELGYGEVRVHLGPELPGPPPAPPTSLVCGIRDEGRIVGHLVVANAAGRPIDPREHELLEMLAEYLAVAIRNSRLYGEVAETKRSLEQLINSAGDAIISIDRDNRVTGWNPAAQRIFGLAAEQAIGVAVSDLLPEEPYRAARSALSSAQPFQGFDVSTQREGRNLDLSVTLSALPGPANQVEGVLAIVRDVTVQRALEAQMLQSEKLTALGQLAGGIAHQFNNLLQAILGYAQLMARNPANVEIIRRGLEVIEGAAAGGAETVRRIQKFARLRPEDPVISVDLNQVIRDALAITRPRWEERAAKGGVPLVLDLDLAPVPPVVGRPSELGEVITNLILNAIDAMASGGTLTIRTAHGPADQVEVTVSDTGLGMTEAVRRRVFDPFFSTKGEEGTGLGLSVSYAIVKRHRGEMRVQSEPGQGATFSIVLPMGSVPGPEAPAPAEPRPDRRARILLVDNEPQILNILGEMLREAGHDVVPAGGGRDALGAFTTGRFDVVMTNIGMIGMTGWELAEGIRTRDREIPIVFITGWGLHEQDRARCRGYGVNTVLFKPLRPADLHRALQDVLAGREEAAPP